MRINRVSSVMILFCTYIIICCNDENPNIGSDIDGMILAVCKYPLNKKSALSITFDDGCPSVFSTIVPMLNSYNLKGTFYIIAGHAEKRNEWEKWKELSKQGHEIGNHSLTHAYYLGPQKDFNILRTEIDSSFNLITSRLGKPPFSFGHPFHSTSASADKFVFKNHRATKISPQGFCRMISLYDIGVCKTEINAAIEKRQWIVTTAHGVDDQYCYNSLTTEFMENFLEYITLHSDSIFVDTFENLAKYKIEAKNSLIITDKTSEKFVVTLKTNLPGQYDYPLTLSISGLEDAQNKIKSLNGGQINVIVSDGKSYVVVPPNSSFAILRD